MQGMFTPERMLDLVNFMTVIVLSTACHEFAHARLADHFGDETPRMAGRITWNPFAHIHIVYTVIVPAILYLTRSGFMAAAFTPVNPSRMRNPRLHGLLVALGGPATNLALSVLCFGALSAYILAIGGLGHGTGYGPYRVADLLYLAVRLNVFLAVFNFLPIPPLDGSDLIAFLLPGRLRTGWLSIRSQASLVFVVLLFAGALNPILDPVIHAATSLVDTGVEAVNRHAHGRG